MPDATIKKAPNNIIALGLSLNTNTPRPSKNTMRVYRNGMTTDTSAMRSEAINNMYPAAPRIIIGKTIPQFVLAGNKLSPLNKTHPMVKGVAAAMV